MSSEMASAPEGRQFHFQIEDAEIRDSGKGGGEWTFRGHAAVFNQWSHDLGGFKERLAPGFFDDVMQRDPDVHLVWDHDTRYVLARNRSKTCELRIDPVGLHVWARIAPTSYAADLRILMERGDVDQMSFMFLPGEDEWEIDEDNRVWRTQLRCAGLYDVTVTARGAYPQTDAQIAERAALTLASAPDEVREQALANADERLVPAIRNFLDGRALGRAVDAPSRDEVGEEESARKADIENERSKAAAQARATIEVARAKNP